MNFQFSILNSQFSILNFPFPRRRIQRHRPYYFPPFLIIFTSFGDLLHLFFPISPLFCKFWGFIRIVFTLSKQLESLEFCDIIRRYVTKIRGRAKTNDAYFQLTDLFTLFHLSFAKTLATEDYWEQRVNTPVINTWQGLAFEHVCMVHIRQIRHALGLDKIAVEYYSWRSSQLCAQIDMIIERADRLINLCELKYTQSQYSITAAEDQKLRNRITAFVHETKTSASIIPTWITPFGLFANEYAAQVSYQVTMDDLFHD